jgi:nicotinamide riboside kinase
MPEAPPPASRRLKVAFIGTHGVGKTTLCYDLAAILKRADWNVDVVKEVARQSPLPINRQTSLDAQTWILMTQVAEEIRSASRHEAVVCDRSVLDNYAYMVLACGRQGALEPFIASWMKTYDVLFKVPVVGAVTPDGVRDTDLGFLQAVDAQVDERLGDMAVPHERLEAAERARWPALVRGVLEGRGLLTRAAVPEV